MRVPWRDKSRAARLCVCALLVAVVAMAASADAASGFTISGKVTSQGSGAGVANTEVVVTESGTSNEVALPTTTASDGSYSVSVPAGAYDLTFTPPSGSELGSFVDRDEVVNGDRTVNVVLIPAGASAFSGKLFGEGGVPLANAYVRVGNEYLTTHADGSFSGSFAPGSYRLEISGYRQSGVSPAAAPYRFDFYGGEVHLSTSLEENLTLPLHALTIRTTGSGGSPIPGVKFIGSPTNTGVGSHGEVAPGINLAVGYVEEDETTNANGETTLSLPYYESESKIEAAPPAETQLARTPINIEKINEDQTREVKLSPGATFSGKLFGEGGVPLANAYVRVGNEYLTTHADGSFSGSFAPGSYRLEISGYRQSGVSPAAAPYRFDFYGGEVHLSTSLEENLTLPLHALTIRTTGSGGSPIPGVKFIGSPTNTGVGSHGEVAPGINLAVGYVEEDETTNANGETTLSLPYYESESKIEAAPPAETQLARTPINIEKINEDQTREVKLSPGATFSGKLFGEGGVPLANAYVRVGNEYLTTHADGSFSGSFAPGSYRLEISGYRQSGVSPAAAPYRFDFYGGEVHLSTSLEENLTLPLHALTIRTTGSGGSPIPGVKFIGSPTNTGVGSHGEVAPGINLAVGYVEEDETTNANGETTLSLPYYESESKIEAAPPAETQLARTPINIEKINEDQTRLLAFGKSGTDVTPPEIQCSSPATGWHAENETLTCTATDSGTGLAHPEDASFSLSTSVPQDEETASAYTNSRRVCDKADNCAEAGPFGPIKIDRKPPTISIASPKNGAVVTQGSTVTAQYSCADGGSGVATCEGSAPSGSPLDTSNLGEHTLTVTSTDAVGNPSSEHVTYKVIAEDTTPPTISIISPEDGEIVNQGTKLTASYTCNDSGSGVASCEGSVPSGSSLDTSSLGEHTLSVAASDVAGNTASRTVHYTVVEPGECGESAQLCETGLGDVTPPSVTSLAISPTSVDTSTSAKAVTVNVHATDDLSGVSAIEINLSNGSRWISAPAQLTAGTRLHGTWDGTLTLPEGSAAGSYVLSVSVIDNVGNHHTYSSQELEALGFPNAVTETGAGDTTPPQLSGVTATPASVSTCNSPQSTTIGIQASDSSGVAYVTAYLIGPGGQSLSEPATLSSGSATSGHWSAPLALPEHAEQGAWSISIQTGDTAGNSTYISSAQLSASGYTSSIEQTCAGDTSPPQVKGVTLEPATVDTSGNSQSIVIDVHATDDLSGVASLQATLSDGGQSQSASASLQAGGTTLDGTWQATITLPRWSRQGTWQLSLTATDRVGNSVSLSSSQIEALGLPHSITQSGEEDDTAPTAHEGSISPNSFDTSQHAVSVAVSLHATDAQSGTELLRVEFTSPNGNQHVYGEGSLTSGTPQEGKWTATLEFPQFSQQGSWTPRLELWDAFGNRRVYTAGELTSIFPTVGVAKKPPPTITKLSAKKGPAAGGTKVTITGSEFVGVSAVRFGTNNASSFTVNSLTSISAIAPPGTSGSTHVTVTTPYGTSAESSKAVFKYGIPTVTEVSPATGSIAGGTKVSLHGSGFATGTGSTLFEFGSTNATNVECSSTTSCTATAPAVTKASTVNVLAKVGKAKSKKAPPGDQYTYS